jgi:hypothetical protein
MQCDKFEERIHESLDQRIAPWSQKELLRHSQDCHRCRDLLTSYEQLSDGLSFFETPTPGEDFSQRVVARFSTVRKGRRYAVLAAAIAALAAGVLLAVLPGMLSDSAPGDVASPGQFAPVDQGEAVESITELKTGASPGDTRGLERGDVDFKQVHVLLDQWATRLSADRWEPVDRFAGGFAPIAEPLSVAIEEIRSTLPLGRPKRRVDPSSDSAGPSAIPAGIGTA